MSARNIDNMARINKPISSLMSYLHAKNSRDHEPQNTEDSKEENLVHCCTVFFAIFLYDEKKQSWRVS